MFIHKLSITTCATGYLVEDETDLDQFIPVGGFGEGQLLNALSFVRDLIERDAADRAADQAMFDAKARGENVVPGPGWKPRQSQASQALFVGEQADRPPRPPEGTITRTIKTDREIVEEVNAVALTLLEQRGFRAAGINPRTYISLERQNPRIREAWENAAAVYEQITGSEVSDALQAVLEEEEAAAAPAVPAEPVS